MADSMRDDCCPDVPETLRVTIGGADGECEFMVQITDLATSMALLRAIVEADDVQCFGVETHLRRAIDAAREWLAEHTIP